VGARILLIEDNPANLELMRYVLAAFGHDVTTTVDGEEGLNSVLRSRPELVICDLQLPRVDGFEVARRMKTHPALKGIPLVAVTAYAMVGDRDRVLAAGFDGYIAKPLEPQSFITQIDSFLSRAQCANALPSAHPDAAATTQAEPPPAASGKKVLVVDDIASNIDLVRTILLSGGHDVEFATNLADARSLAEASPPDLIISDYHIGRELGGDFAAWVRSHPRLSPTPFMLMSSTALAESDWKSGLERGADRFIMRPISPRSFLEEVAGCLAISTER
jgi:CheY-like chemotaxis protein